MLQAAFGLLDGLEREVGGDGGEDIELPGKVLAVGAGGHFELDEVADRRGDHGIIVLEILGIAGLSLLGEFAKSFGEGFGEICRYRGLLGDDESFGHEADLGGEGGGWEEISFEAGCFRRKNLSVIGVREAGIILMAADLLPLSLERLVAWSDDRIRASENPDYWLIEISMALVLEDALGSLRGVASGKTESTEHRIAIVIEGWRSGLVPLDESLWKLWRVWQGPRYEYKTEGFSEEFKGLLIAWDQTDGRIPEGIQQETVSSFEKFHEDHREVCVQVRPFVSMTQAGSHVV